MKISVIVPIYNVEKYLDNCLESIVLQDFPTSDYEVILVNDGSTDGSRDIADRYVKANSNFIMVDKVNGGLSSARNAGLAKASGEYVCFVDSDDFISNRYLPCMYEAAKQYEADMVFADYHKVSQDGHDMMEDKGNPRYERGLVTQKDAVYALTSVGDNHFATTVVVAWNKLIKREIMKKHLYPEGLLHEDEFVIMPLLMDCDRIVWIDDDVYAYRQRKASIMQNPELALKHLVILDAFKNRIELSKGYNDAELTKEFAKAYFWDIEVWYYFMRETYHVPKWKIYFFFTSKMRKHILNYPRTFWKKKMLNYVIFSLSPEFYLKHMYK